MKKHRMVSLGFEPGAADCPKVSVEPLSQRLILLCVTCCFHESSECKTFFSVACLTDVCSTKKLNKTLYFNWASFPLILSSNTVDRN